MRRFLLAHGPLVIGLALAWRSLDPTGPSSLAESIALNLGFVAMIAVWQVLEYRGVVGDPGGPCAVRRLAMQTVALSAAAIPAHYVGLVLYRNEVVSARGAALLFLPWALLSLISWIVVIALSFGNEQPGMARGRWVPTLFGVASSSINLYLAGTFT